MFRALSTTLLFSSVTLPATAAVQDLTLRCVWTIDGFDHVARSTFRHLGDGRVLVELVSNDVECPAYSEPDLTYPGRQYFVCRKPSSHGKQ